MKEASKAQAVLGIALIMIAALGIALAFNWDKVGGGKKSAPKVTTVSKLQTLIDRTKKSAVASARVVSCKDAGPQTIGGNSFAKVYACPVLIAMKDGSGGCAGVLMVLDNGNAVVIAQPSAIDARYCA